MLTTLLACSASGLTAPVVLEGRITAAETPVVLTVEGLKPGSAYRLRIYDRFLQSERQDEDASSKTLVQRPDGSAPESYWGTHDGFHYSDDPEGFLFFALDRSILVSAETSRDSGAGLFRIMVEPVDPVLVQGAVRSFGELNGVPLVSRGVLPGTGNQSASATAAPSPSTAAYGVYLHGSSLVPAARDLQGRNTRGGSLLFVSHGERRFADFPGAAAVYGLQLDTAERVANAAVAGLVAESAAVYFDGGDQSIYYRAWKDSAFVEAVNRRLAEKKISIGGNSAGLAILGDFVYAALHDHSLSASEALLDPYNQWMTLEKGLFATPGLEQVITDSHFAERERQGRLAAFLARILQDQWSEPGKLLGIGIDENTTLVLDELGQAKVFGPGSAWLFVPQTLPAVCQSGKPLHWPGEAIKVIQLTEEYTRNNGVIWRTVRTRPADFFYSVDQGRLRSSAETEAVVWASLEERLQNDPTSLLLEAAPGETLAADISAQTKDVFVRLKLIPGRSYALYLADSYNNGQNPGLQVQGALKAAAYWLLLADGQTSYPEEVYKESEGDSKSSHGFLGITPDGKAGPVAVFAAEAEQAYVQIQGYRASYTGKVALKLVEQP